MCSTPRGVTAFCTPAPASPWPGTSVFHTPRRLRVLPTRARTKRRQEDPRSTPRSVTAFCTLKYDAVLPQQMLVLNASRRHCLLHKTILQRQQTIRLVLNASRRHCLLHAPTGQTGGGHFLVLNASRRHCLLHA